MPEETGYSPEQEQLESLINETLAEEEAPKKLPEPTQAEKDLVKTIVKRIQQHDKEKLQVAIAQTGAGMSSSALEIAKKIMADAGMPGPVHPPFEEAVPGGIPATHIPRRTAAVEVIKNINRVNRLALISLICLLIAVGAAPIEYIIALIAGAVGMGYSMWEFMNSKNNITFLKQKYGV